MRRPSSSIRWIRGSASPFLASGRISSRARSSRRERFDLAVVLGDGAGAPGDGLAVGGKPEVAAFDRAHLAEQAVLDLALIEIEHVDAEVGAARQDTTLAVGRHGGAREEPGVRAQPRPDRAGGALVPVEHEGADVRIETTAGAFPADQHFRRLGPHPQRGHARRLQGSIDTAVERCQGVRLELLALVRTGGRPGAQRHFGKGQERVIVAPRDTLIRLFLDVEVERAAELLFLAHQLPDFGLALDERKRDALALGRERQRGDVGVLVRDAARALPPGGIPELDATAIGLGEELAVGGEVQRAVELRMREYLEPAFVQVEQIEEANRGALLVGILGEESEVPAVR